MYEGGRSFFQATTDHSPGNTENIRKKPQLIIAVPDVTQTGYIPKQNAAQNSNFQSLRLGETTTRNSSRDFPVSYRFVDLHTECGRVTNKRASCKRWYYSEFNFLPKFSQRLAHDILKVMTQNTMTTYVSLTWVKPAKKHPATRWEINLLKHKAKLLNPVTSNGFHYAHSTYLLLRWLEDIRLPREGIVIQGPEMTEDPRGKCEVTAHRLWH